MIKNIIFGISGTSLTEHEKQLFLLNPVVGFILFKRNIDSKEQVIELTNELKNLYPERKTLIFVDQEGGRVQRIKPDIGKKTYAPSAFFSKLYDEDVQKGLDATLENYFDIASELKEFNIDSSCAPVCDLYFQFADNVIGDRSFGNDPEKVTELASAAINGILMAKSLPFLKHIPGHGRAKVDSHLDLPIVDEELDLLENTDFKVFKDLATKFHDHILWGMTAHIVYSCLDNENPFTLSKEGIRYLREKIGFAGILVTDDISMYALHGEIGQKHLAMTYINKILLESDPLRSDLLSKRGDYIKHIFSLDNMDLNILEMLQSEQQDEVNRLFCDSTAKIAQLSIAAGCDIVLHCSGNIDEMYSICSAI